MTPESANTVVAAAAVAALVVVALAALIAAIALWRVARDVRRVSGSLDTVVVSLQKDLPQTLKEMRETAANLNRLSDELGPRLLRVDALLDDGEATLQSLRATVETAEDIVRGPAAAMDRAKRAAGAAGRALSSGADRIRRSVTDRMGGDGDGDRDGDDDKTHDTKAHLLGAGGDPDPRPDDEGAAADGAGLAKTD